MTLIGLVGRKRVGKDSVGKRLVERHGYTRLAFADALRHAALALDPIVDVLPDLPAWGARRLSEVVRTMGWEAAKDQVPEVRRVLQNYGVAIRDIDVDFWVDVVLRQVEPGRPTVITDVRFPNEADAVEAAGGVLVRVVRPLPDDGDTHPSETTLSDRPTAATIVNDRDLHVLRWRVDWLARQM